MNIKKIALSIMPILILPACSDILTNHTNQLKWAVVDKEKILKALMDDYINHHPNPDGLGDESELIRNLSTIQKQISQLESEGRQKCLNDLSAHKKESKSTEQTAKSLASSSPDVLHINGHDVPRNAIPRGPFYMEEIGVEKYPKTNPVIYTDEYKVCTSNASQDPLVAELNLRANKIHEAQEKRRKNDIDIRKKIEENIKTLIEKYAKTKNIELVVSHYGDNNILYNADKVTLNVTEDVIDYMATMNPNEKPETP